jgi:hypothetical protein
MLLCGLLLLAESARGQQDEDSPPPATHSTWATGVQLFPVLGVSVRWAATPRFTLQAAALPGVGGDFRGTVGARGLYKFVHRDGYNVYASAGVVPFFVQTRSVQPVFNTPLYGG